MEFQLEEIRRTIAQTTDVDKLRVLRDQIHEKLLVYPLDSFPGDWNDWVNTLHDGLIRFAVKQAEEELAVQGAGRPPVSYAMLLFGSGGRREQTLWSDQDNGLVYRDPLPGEDEAAEVYFAKFGKTVVDILFRLGYPPCEGNVMCNNPLWSQSASGWRKTVHDWLDDPSWENIRYVLIMADSRCISGDQELATGVKDLLLQRVEADEGLLEDMLRNTLRRKVSLGVLGNLIPERFGEDMGGIDIKYGAYIPLVNTIRLLAIRHKITSSGTLDRIREMEQRGAESKELAAEWRSSFQSVLKLRSLTSNRLEDGYYQSSGVLPGAMLTKERKKELKSALRTAQKLHKYVEKEIQSD
jgi:CBS domain-containing protein